MKGLLVAAATVLVSAVAPAPPASAQAGPSLDVRLMTEHETAPAAACGMRLWQSNKVPGNDRFAYAIAIPVTEAEAATALVKIGLAPMRFERIASGGEGFGPIRPILVFRAAKAHVTVLLELLDFEAKGDRATIADARMTAYGPDHIPFPVRLMGTYSCPREDVATAAAQPVGVKKALDLQSWNEVPRVVLERVRTAPGCEPEALDLVWGAIYETGDGGSQIWELPCFIGAYQSAMVYIHTLKGEPETARLMPFRSPATGPREQAWLMEPRLDPATGTVVSVEFDQLNAACGTYQRHRLVSAPAAAALRFELIEYRAKTSCDDTVVPVEQFPLVFETGRKGEAETRDRQ